jgi:hypothetical protein
MKRLLRLCSNRKSRRELLSTSEASWATTKSGGMCYFPNRCYNAGEEPGEALYILSDIIQIINMEPFSFNLL